MPITRAPEHGLAPGAAWVAAALLLAGCTSVPEQPALPTPLTPPTRFATQAPTPAATGATVPQAAPDNAADPSTPWWRRLDDAQLQALIEQALLHNRDLGMARARIEQAQALATIDRAAQGPTVTLSPMATRSRTASTVDPAVRVTGPDGSPGAVEVTTRTHASRTRWPLDVAYEADLWGRLERTSSAAEQRARASDQDLAFARLAVVASVVTTHQALQTHLQQQRLLEEVAHQWRRRIDALQARVATGLADDEALEAARIGATDAHTQVQRTRERIALDQHALAVLCGQMPSETAAPAHQQLPAPADALPVPADLPARVLQRRPDVRGAQARLDAAWDEVGSARADFFPSLRLTGSAGLESSDLSTLLEPGSLVWSVAAQISAVLFDGGRRDAQFRAARARLDEAARQYEGTVLQALRDVEDALASVASLRAQAVQGAVAVEAARLRADRARRRADVGLASRLIEVEHTQAWLQQQVTLLDVQREDFAARVGLYKALALP